jgi:tetratricopeptide (TPR) repeat protein
MRNRRGTEGTEERGRTRLARTLCVFCASAVVLLSLFPRAAAADTPPNAWDVAKDPAARDRWTLHEKVEKKVNDPFPEGVEGIARLRLVESRLEEARLLLESAHAADSPDVRLRFDLGVIDEELASDSRRLDLHKRAVEVLAPAIQMAPDDPGATRALASLVIAYAHLDEPQKELAAWALYLPRLTDDRERNEPMMNMGEAQMRVGQLEDALWTFREVLRLCGSVPNSTAVNMTYALTLWDLALALDRSGDFGSALDTALRAGAHKWLRQTGPALIETETGWDVIVNDREVFFAPAWERDWYIALGNAAEAHAAKDPRDAVKYWALAVQHWTTYVNESAHTKPDDRWLTLARTRLDYARTEHDAAAKRAAKLPPRPERDSRPWRL